MSASSAGFILTAGGPGAGVVEDVLSGNGAARGGEGLLSGNGLAGVKAGILSDGAAAAVGGEAILSDDAAAAVGREGILPDDAAAGVGQGCGEVVVLAGGIVGVAGQGFPSAAMTLTEGTSSSDGM